MATPIDEPTIETLAMATPTDESTMETLAVATPSDEPTMKTIGALSDVPIVTFKVARGFGGIVENAKVNVDRLYLRQIRAGWDANQSDVIQPNAVTGLGRTAVNNWAVYDGAGSNANLVAKTHGMHTLAGKWSNWFTLVFVDERYVRRVTLNVLFHGF